MLADAAGAEAARKRKAAAEASAQPAFQYIGDRAGTTFRITVRNVGRTPIGAIEVGRPGPAWDLAACPQAPKGWKRRRSDAACRFLSKAAARDDVKRGKSAVFAVKATTDPGTRDRSGDWKVRVSPTNSLAKGAGRVRARAGAIIRPLRVTAHAIEVTDVTGAVCPAHDHDLLASERVTLHVCGVNHATIPVTPSASASRLTGSLLAEPGTFAGGPVAAGSTGVLGSFVGAKAAVTPGPSEISAQVGTATGQTSPLIRLTGYQVVPLGGGGTRLNVAPVLGGIDPLPVPYLENEPPTTVTDTITVTDPDSAIVSATITTASLTPGDTLSFSDQSGISGSYDAGTGALSLSGAASAATYQAALRTLRFSSAGEDPAFGERAIGIQVSDGAAVSNTVADHVFVLPIDDAPVVSGVPARVDYLESAASDVTAEVALAPALEVADADSPTLTGATVRLTTNRDPAEDELRFTSRLGITGAYDSGSGVLSLTGSASKADYQAALRSVGYRNTSDEPSTATRTFSIQVDTGGTLSTAQTGTIAVTAANDVPLLGGVEAQPLPYAESQSPTPVTSTLTLVDPDSTITGATVRISGNLSGSQDLLDFVDQLGITATYSSATGVLTLTGTQSAADYEAALQIVTYENRSEAPSTLPRTIEFQVSDGTASSNAVTRVVAVAAANDAPQAGDLVTGTPCNTRLGTLPFAGQAGRLLASNLLEAVVDPERNELSLTTGTFPTGDGGIVVIEADGDFTYVPRITSTGNDSFGYTVTDGSGASDTGEVTITLGDCIWYVDNTAAPNGDGRSNAPFDTLAEAEAAAAPGQSIYVFQGNGTTSGQSAGIDLKSNQKLIGGDLVIGGFTLYDAAAGEAATISGNPGVTLSTGNTVQGLTVRGAGGPAIRGDATSGDITLDRLGIVSDSSGLELDRPTGFLHVDSVDVNASGGAALNLLHIPSVTAHFGDVTSTNSPTSGIRLVGLPGTLTVASGTISSAQLSAVEVTGGNGLIDVGSDVDDGAGLSLDESDRTGGTLTMSGRVTDGPDQGGGVRVRGGTGGVTTFSAAGSTFDTGGDHGILLDAPGHALNLTGGGLGITTREAKGINAFAGTITVSGAQNAITSGPGSAIELDGTTIGPAGLTFRSISASGGVNGIVLRNTGSAGGLTVTGDGGTANNGSGGTIADMTGDGVVLDRTTAATLQRMNISGPAGNGIAATRATDATITRMNLSDSGQTAASFTLHNGTLSAASNSIIRSNGAALRLEPGPGTSSLSVTNNSIQATHGSALNYFNSAGTSTITVSGNTIVGSTEAAVAGTTGPGLQSTYTITGNSLQSNATHIDLLSPGGAQEDITIAGNTLFAALGDAVAVIRPTGPPGAPQGRMYLRISSNTIGSPVPNGGSRDRQGILVDQTSGTASFVRINENRVRGTELAGIQVINDAGSIDLHLKGNDVSAPALDGPGPSAVLAPGVSLRASAAGSQCLAMSDNSSAGAGGAAPYVVRNDSDSEPYVIDGLTPGPTTNGAFVSSFLTGRQSAGEVSAELGSGAAFSGTGGCVLPP